MVGLVCVVNFVWCVFLGCELLCCALFRCGDGGVLWGIGFVGETI